MLISYCSDFLDDDGFELFADSIMMIWGYLSWWFCLFSPFHHDVLRLYVIMVCLFSPFHHYVLRLHVMMVLHFSSIPSWYLAIVGHVYFRLCSSLYDCYTSWFVQIQIPPACHETRTLLFMSIPDFYQPVIKPKTLLSYGL